MANLVTLQGENQPIIRNVMTLKSCSPIAGADVISFDTEREVLLAWRVILLNLHMLMYLITTGGDTYQFMPQPYEQTNTDLFFLTKTVRYTSYKHYWLK